MTSQLKKAENKRTETKQRLWYGSAPGAHISEEEEKATNNSQLSSTTAQDLKVKFILRRCTEPTTSWTMKSLTPVQTPSPRCVRPHALPTSRRKTTQPNHFPEPHGGMITKKKTGLEAKQTGDHKTNLETMNAHHTLSSQLNRSVWERPMHTWVCLCQPPLIVQVNLHQHTTLTINDTWIQIHNKLPTLQS